MSTVFLNMRLKDWVQLTARRMDEASKEDTEYWRANWSNSYYELGGKNQSSSIKGCPMHAAYGLWFLGRIRGSKRPILNWDLRKIDEKLGKNAAYAILALQYLQGTRGSVVRVENWTRAKLWAEVQKAYKQELRKKPAQSEQGAIGIVLGLFREGELI